MNHPILSICIPNYNRINKLVELTNQIINQIRIYTLEDVVEICISDDGSLEDPSLIVQNLKRGNRDIQLNYSRHFPNRGMDFNFLKVVKMSCGKYCWIIGNDDKIENNTLLDIIELLINIQKKEVDIIVTPFDTYDYDGKYITTHFPLEQPLYSNRIFDLSNHDDKNLYFSNIKHNSGLFGFLSNTIFKKDNWIINEEKFSDKMNTIFIQVYMNLQTLIDGGKIINWDKKIIVNNCDFNPKDKVDLLFKISKGLYDAVCYFFDDDMQCNLLDTVVSEFILKDFWDCDKSVLHEILKMKLPIVEFYNNCYIKKIDRNEFFHEKNVVVFGAAGAGAKTVALLQTYGAVILAYADNDEKKWGLIENGIRVYSPSDIVKLYSENITIVIASVYCKEIYHQLLSMGMRNIYMIR